MTKKVISPALVEACRAAGFSALGVAVSRGQATRILVGLRDQDEGLHVPALQAVVSRLAKGGYSPSADDGSFARRAGHAALKQAERDRALDLRHGGEEVEWGDSDFGGDDPRQRGGRPGF